MSRWTIEKDGTGIEKSGTGIEKSGTGIEKSGTGIEKSGTGISKALLAFSIVAMSCVSVVNASELRPEGVMQVTVDQGQVSVMWNIDGSTFVGVGSQTGTFSQVSLFEMSIGKNPNAVDVAGGGTGIAVAGGGTGIKVAGGGTGIEVAGGGTGIEVAGGGTGIEVAGGGTGIEVAGGGTGLESITITLPSGTGLEMEVTLGCQSASVSVLDTNFTEVIAFNNVRVMGDTGLCGSNNFAAPGFRDDSFRSSSQRRR